VYANLASANNDDADNDNDDNLPINTDNARVHVCIGLRLGGI
jgi:hypothetical protein